MFNRGKKESEQPVSYQTEKTRAALEAALDIKQIEIEALKKKLELKSAEVADYDHQKYKATLETNEQLKKRVAELEAGIKNNSEIEKLKASNNIEIIKLQADNERLSARISALNDEKEYLKKVIDTYQELPDTKKMIEGLSSLTVPGFEELEKFAAILNGSKITDVLQKLELVAHAAEANNNNLKDFLFRARR